MKFLRLYERFEKLNKQEKDIILYGLLLHYIRKKNKNK